MLLVYRVNDLPDPARTVAAWRNWAKEKGYPGLYLVVVRSFEITDPRTYGFDAAVEFPPHQIKAREVGHGLEMVNTAHAGRIYDYADMAGKYAAQKPDGYICFKGVMPGWDNEARRPGGGNSFVGNTPALFGRWMERACAVTVGHAPAERFLFINAWNEWAEGAYLEPDRRHGHAYLNALADALEKFKARG
jgi:lipopolysaccharide biosynthesis protein